MHVAKIYFAVRPANEQSKKMRGTLTMVSEANYRGLGQNFPKGNFFCNAPQKYSPRKKNNFTVWSGTNAASRNFEDLCCFVNPL
jgi:hypothetical protein